MGSGLGAEVGGRVRVVWMEGVDEEVEVEQKVHRGGGGRREKREGARGLISVHEK